MFPENVRVDALSMVRFLDPSAISDPETPEIAAMEVEDAVMVWISNIPPDERFKEDDAMLPLPESDSAPPTDQAPLARLDPERVSVVPLFNTRDPSPEMFPPKVLVVPASVRVDPVSNTMEPLAPVKAGIVVACATSKVAPDRLIAED